MSDHEPMDGSSRTSAAASARIALRAELQRLDTQTVREQLPHTRPDWLTEAQAIRDAIPYDIDDHARTPLDQTTLHRLAQLSQHMSPWDAARETFGDQP